MDVAGAYGVVTGASSGIGRAVALRLAGLGCRLVLVGRDKERLDELAGRTGGEVRIADFADEESVAALASWLAALDPVPDILLNNAGIGAVADAATGDGEQLPGYDDATGNDLGSGVDFGSGVGRALRGAELERLLAVNLRAPIALTRAVLPGMLRRGSGHLGYVSSIAALLGVPRESSYAVVKAALHAYGRSLHAEVTSRGVGVSVVAPGIVDTEFFDRRGVPYVRRFPRPISPDRVAARIVRAIERERAEVIVPRWLRIPVALQAVAPTTYARLAGRHASSRSSPSPRRS
ncbi:SDR family NAD(P)-dependent oxidoreductase [Actinopolymorpha sp. B9G3]|uniref:SDR family NAD(P)-dependent oxidoreductase n=1 Tax=Actinopolymorpha sp. B9G3 TaxID=3158970 RepID=UPI0032D94E62